MRFSILAVTLASCFLTTGCSSLVSLTPFVSDKDSVLDTALLGVWKDAGGEMLYTIAEQRGAYAITAVDLKKNETIRCEARLVRVGEASVFDVVPQHDDALQLEAHYMVRVWAEGSRLRVAFLDSDWLKQQAVQQVPTQEVKGRTVLTGSTEMVRAFVMTHGSDPKAYKETEMLDRVQ